MLITIALILPLFILSYILYRLNLLNLQEKESDSDSEEMLDNEESQPSHKQVCKNFQCVICKYVSAIHSLHWKKCCSKNKLNNNENKLFSLEISAKLCQ